MKKIILIDDDVQNISLSKLILSRLLGKEIEIIDFTDPEIGIKFLHDHFSNTQTNNPATLFLDINMGSMDAWKFLEKFETFSQRIKEKINIYILSSSINQEEIDLSKTNRNVIDFIEKPLNKKSISKVFA